MKEGVGVEAKSLDVDSHDIARIKKAHARERLLLIAAGPPTAVLSFVAGALARDAVMLDYPYAIGSSISGAAFASTAVNRKLVVFIIALLALGFFVLGILLTGGETHTNVYPPGEAPEYGVYGS